MAFFLFLQINRKLAWFQEIGYVTNTTPSGLLKMALGCHSVHIINKLMTTEGPRKTIDQKNIYHKSHDFMLLQSRNSNTILQPTHLKDIIYGMYNEGSNSFYFCKPLSFQLNTIPKDNPSDEIGLLIGLASG